MEKKTLKNYNRKDNINTDLIKVLMKNIELSQSSIEKSKDLINDYKTIIKPYKESVFNKQKFKIDVTTLNNKVSQKYLKSIRRQLSIMLNYDKQRSYNFYILRISLFTILKEQLSSQIEYRFLFSKLLYDFLEQNNLKGRSLQDLTMYESILYFRTLISTHYRILKGKFITHLEQTKQQKDVIDYYLRVYDYIRSDEKLSQVYLLNLGITFDREDPVFELQNLFMKLTNDNLYYTERMNLIESDTFIDICINNNLHNINFS